MNHITKRNRLQKQLASYWQVLPTCTLEQGKKLMQEILKLDAQIIQINNMTLPKLQEPIDDYFITKPSKINNESRTKTNGRFHSGSKSIASEYL